MPTSLLRRWVPASAALALVLLAPVSASAFEPFAQLVPCRATETNSVGTVRPCITCHNNADGGSGCDTPPCFNPFGTAFSGPRAWSPALAMADADGDTYSNGEELCDPSGGWSVGMAFPANCACASRPGFPDSTPGDTDADDDGVCCRGVDLDDNGDCLGEGEHEPGSTDFDCNDSDDTINSSAAEVCTNALDNDCDGLPTLLDPDCADVVDRDGDGYCPMGRDNDGDRGCFDPGEATGDVDCDDDEPTVSPAAREFCVDTLDNDCDTHIDAADDECTTDVDEDGDGYCPIGRDLNANGNCNDTVDGVIEAEAGFDCHDGNDAINPDASEVCTDSFDNDCDGLADFRDDVDCGAFFDADSDGYCPGGVDGDGDGNCTGEGEAVEPFDCNDADGTISPGSMEICTNGPIDDDCDLAASLDDADCAGWIDTDGDSFCFVGVDSDDDGTCVDEGEATGNGDCDEEDAAVHPTATEICTDGIDNDCDGSTDAPDRGDCDEYRDTDGDGYCLVGQDTNDDGDCSDADEQSGPTEWTGEMDPFTDSGTEGIPMRYPGAPEHCLNRIDEDLDGMVDEEGYCRRDVDADGDGWCPIGQDLDGDGTCTGEGENIAATDCNDGEATVSPGEAERCLELVDADCDGDFGVADTDCFVLLDRDGDGFCPTGIDDNADGDCLDEAEDRFGVDCDDRDAMVNTRQRETCDDEIDNDCDGDIDFADSQCDCETAADCDDGDACTADVCGDDGECSHGPEPMCTDAGPMSDGGPPPPPDDGCGCRTVGRPAATWPLLALGLLAFFFFLVRRRR